MNTQEKETELGEGVTSAEFWVYDGKLGRRWNVDPVRISLMSAYCVFAGNPVVNVDINGDRPEPNKADGSISNKFYFAKFRKSDSKNNNDMSYEENTSLKRNVIDAIKGGIGSHTYKNATGNQEPITTKFECYDIDQDKFENLSLKDEKKLIRKLKKQGYTIV